jgi:hypothetical protein
MELKAISDLTNLGLPQANTAGWGNIFKAYDVVNGWYIGTCFVLMMFTPNSWHMLIVSA